MAHLSTRSWRTKTCDKHVVIKVCLTGSNRCANRPTAQYMPLRANIPCVGIVGHTGNIKEGQKIAPKILKK